MVVMLSTEEHDAEHGRPQAGGGCLRRGIRSRALSPTARSRAAAVVRKAPVDACIKCLLTLNLCLLFPIAENVKLHRVGLAANVKLRRIGLPANVTPPRIGSVWKTPDNLQKATYHINLCINVDREDALYCPNMAQRALVKIEEGIDKMSEAMTQHSTARARSVAFCGLSIALMAVAAWITVPFGPVPFTLQTLAVMFVLFALPAKQALIAIGGYIALGGLGLPVFSSFKGGLAALMGPTGGFIVGFFVAALVAIAVAALLKRTPLFASEEQKSFFGTHIAAGVLARNVVMGVVFLAVLYVFGWAWLMLAAHLSAEAAFVAAVAPFVLIDAMKMIAAVLIAQAVSAVVAR